MDIQAAFEAIIAEGRKAYSNPDLASRAAAFGQGISRVCDDPCFLIEAAGEHAEDWNYHDTAKELRKMVDSLNS